MRDHEAGVPVHQGVPELFREACESLFTIPMSESRRFICRTWVRKPLNKTTDAPTPACFIISAQRVADATTVAACVQSILDHIWIETNAGDLDLDGVNAIITTLTKRCHLLTLAVALNVFDDIGVPVFYSQDQDIREILVMPFLSEVGFSPRKIDEQTPRVPTKC